MIGTDSHRDVSARLRSVTAHMRHSDLRTQKSTGPSGQLEPVQKSKDAALNETHSTEHTSEPAVNAPVFYWYEGHLIFGVPA